ncbi:hypothetical protein FSP39_009344 [Pinctada imbricata]|uniref:C-type lectin domain-containing protein n=1 Tax=Pinctada imbricata TaxID=66713 RepID=A0AA88Y8D1_PINIB|nr:hypothetical protein FSP39_009344 [Pinctada imbricata]
MLFVIYVLSFVGWRIYWIGGTDLGTEGTFYWEHTGKAISNKTYSLWHGHEPNGRTRENCLMAWHKTFKNEWNDQSCDIPQAYLCEKN